MALLKVTGLSKQFGGLRAVDNVDFHIESGEIVGLIGPNGAGKSTFVELLTGGIPATAGRIEFDGHHITRLRSHERCRLGMGRTFQIPQPFSGSSVLDNVVVGALNGCAQRRLSIADARNKAERVLEDVGLAAFAAHRPSSLTTAGLKKLEVARCLATDARMVFLDEPLGGLNSTEVKDALTLISRLRSNGITILFIEHIIPAVLSVSDRVVVLANGRKLAEGSGDEVTRNPEVQRAYLGDLSATASHFARRREGAGRSTKAVASPGVQA